MNERKNFWRILGYLPAILLILVRPSFSQTFDSFVRRMGSLPIEKRQALADSFIQVTEPFPISEDSLAHFVFMKDGGADVTVAGDFNDWKADVDSMKSVPGTELYGLTKRFERDARLDYKIVIGGTDWTLDPLNPNLVNGGFGPNSELAMPEYVQPAEIQFDPEIPHGKIDTLQFNSRVLNNDRQVLIYLPPGYSNSSAWGYPILFVNDGSEYLSLGSMANVLDNLIHENRIRELIAVFVDPVKRDSEYWLNGLYKRMIVSELLPWIDLWYPISDKPSERGVMGASLGGIAAMDIAITHPDVFGLCASQSGAFWIEDAKIVNLIQNAQVKGIRFYLDWGSYEPSISGLNARIGRILESKGCRVKTLEFHEGHSWGSWRAHLDEILTFFFPQN